MTSDFKKIRVLIYVIICVGTASVLNAQAETEKWKLQLSVGINNPIDDVNNDGFYTKYINIPSVNFGIQHMFTAEVGAKLDFGFNRSSNADGSNEFKLNYSRVNVQFVYNATDALGFLPEPISVVTHMGPGASFTKPLGNDSENEYTFLNALGGVEFHFRMSRTFSIYTDISYAFSLSGKDKYDPVVDGFSFNGDLLIASIGVSVSLSGCSYCY